MSERREYKPFQDVGRKYIETVESENGPMDIIDPRSARGFEVANSVRIFFKTLNNPMTLEQIIDSGIILKEDGSKYNRNSQGTLRTRYLDCLVKEKIIDCFEEEVGPKLGRPKKFYSAKSEFIERKILRYAKDIEGYTELFRKRIKDFDPTSLNFLTEKSNFEDTLFLFLMAILSEDGRNVVFSLNPVMFYKEEYSYEKNWKRFEAPRKEGIITYKNAKSLRKVYKVLGGEGLNWATYHEETPYKRAFEYYCYLIPEGPRNVDFADELLLGVLVSRFYLDVLGKNLYKQFAPDYMEHVMRETKKIVKDLKHLKWYWKNGRKLNPGEKPW